MSEQQNTQSGSKVNTESIDRLFQALITLRQEARRLEKEEITRELSSKFEELASIINAIRDFNNRNKYAFYVRPVNGASDGRNVEIASIHNTGLAVDIKVDAIATLTDIYDKFFNDPKFTETAISYMISVVDEIIGLISRNADVYTRIAELHGKIDQLYQDVKRLCPQQDP